ncbi:hypothetical protein BKA66DRAFT_570173 [Pyrenochaeta sp. MPI-SDFR-AT-0127]|nr:hypothetical protein BKA66DRAFT_570173 [Pyrenochaeta sp. MPI-SDFR-AT-0127]
MFNEQKCIEMIRLFYRPQEQFLPQTSGYRGLTQLCRQVRHEFLPIYQKRTVYVEIDVHDAARFVNTFYGLNDLQALGRASGSIEISFDREAPGDHVDKSNQVDLLPLLRLLVMAPHLHARFIATTYISGNGVPIFIHDLGILLRIPKVERDEIRKHLFHSIQRLILAPLPSLMPDAEEPELEIWLASESMGHDLTMRKRLLYETGLVSLKELGLALRFGPNECAVELRSHEYLAAFEIL